MTSFTDTWNAGYEATPPDSENASQGASRIRSGRRDVRERMEVDHSWAGDANDGAHKRLTLPPHSPFNPSTPGSKSLVFYTRDDGIEGSRPYYKDSTGREHSMLPPGTIVPCIYTTVPPDGWLMCWGQTIGSASSAGTALAHASALALFTVLWNNLDNTAAPVSGGRGASASADWTANKTITLPSFIGRSPLGYGQGNTAEGGGLGTGRGMGQAGGAETHTLTTAQMPSHTHGVTTNGEVTGTGGIMRAAGAPSIVVNTGSTGGSTAHNNMHPFLTTNFIIKI